MSTSPSHGAIIWAQGLDLDIALTRECTKVCAEVFAAIPLAAMCCDNNFDRAELSSKNS